MRGGRTPLSDTWRVNWSVFRVGQWAVEGRGRLCTDALGSTIDCTADIEPNATEGNSKTSLTIMPLGVGAIYRLDYFHKEKAIPVLPYAKGGIDYNVWWARSDGKVSSTTIDGKKVSGTGGSWSYTGSIGVALNIDWLDPTASRGSRTLAGSFLFIEATMIGGTDIGAGKKLDVSDTGLAAGLALDFF